MENSARSERSRTAAIQAALTIISRDGPGRLTLDAIARESGISKGGVMHQFRTKGAVLKALLEHQIDHFKKFTDDYLAALGPDRPEAQLSAQIATLRQVAVDPQSVAFAILAAMAEEPELLTMTRAAEVESIERIKAEAEDPDLAMLRWAAARGLALGALFGLTPLPDADRERLFDRLLDGAQWGAVKQDR